MPADIQRREQFANVLRRIETLEAEERDLAAREARVQADLRTADEALAHLEDDAASAAAGLGEGDPAKLMRQYHEARDRVAVLTGALAKLQARRRELEVEREGAHIALSDLTLATIREEAAPNITRTIDSLLAAKKAADAIVALAGDAASDWEERRVHAGRYYALTGHRTESGEIVTPPRWSPEQAERYLPRVVASLAAGIPEMLAELRRYGASSAELRVAEILEEVGADG